MKEKKPGTALTKTAKELFWDYACSHYFLSHDGMMDEYIQLGGNDPEKEKEWRKEYIQFWLNQIDSNEFEVFSELNHANAVEVIDDLIAFYNFKDDYIKFWYAFALNDLQRFSKNIISKFRARSRARSIFKELSKKDIFLNKESRKDITREIMKAFDAKTKEEYITNYSREMLKRR